MLDWLLISVKYIFDFFFNIVTGLAVSEFNQMYEILGRVFPRPFTHGGICPSHIGGQVQGDKSLMGGGLMRGTDLMGGPNFDRLYHKPKVLLLLSCKYTMQFIGYDCIKTR